MTRFQDSDATYAALHAIVKKAAATTKPETNRSATGIEWKAIRNPIRR